MAFYVANLTLTVLKVLHDAFNKGANILEMLRPLCCAIPQKESRPRFP